MVLFVLELEWVLSTGQDKQLAWHCSESGQRLGSYRTSAVASGLQYPLLDKNPLVVPWLLTPFFHEKLGYVRRERFLFAALLC